MNVPFFPLWLKTTAKSSKNSNFYVLCSPPSFFFLILVAIPSVTLYSALKIGERSAIVVPYEKILEGSINSV